MAYIRVCARVCAERMDDSSNAKAISFFLKMQGVPLVCQTPPCPTPPPPPVVISRAFFLFSPCNHIINIYKKSFSGEVKDSVIFPFFFFTES
jgi:hypothetical protein